MSALHAKLVRRRILSYLYERYVADPLEMATPEDLMTRAELTKEDLVFNIYYLTDRGLVELMRGYRPPLFAAVRLTADGVDVVENRFEFDLRFPPAPDDPEALAAEVPRLMEQLVEEADFVPLDREARRALLRDVQYVRDELARHPERWRRAVIWTVLGWIAEPVDDPDEHLPTLRHLRRTLEELQG